MTAFRSIRALILSAPLSLRGDRLMLLLLLLSRPSTRLSELLRLLWLELHTVRMSQPQLYVSVPAPPCPAMRADGFSCQHSTHRASTASSSRVATAAVPSEYR